MKRNVIICSTIVIAFALALAAFLTFSPQEQQPAQAHEPGSGAIGRLVRADSHRLGEPGTGKVLFVEFLDFECEACGAAYPVVEDLRTKYAGRVDFVVRYFPIPSHQNAMNAAIAVEAASQQGKFEGMYQRMYETQSSWGEQKESKAALFRTYATDLGLDMAAYDRAVADPKTGQRVERDRKDGVDLGVQGTPTFFLNGKRLQAESAQDLYDQIDAALRG